MHFSIQRNLKGQLVYLIHDTSLLDAVTEDKAEREYALLQINNGIHCVQINRFTHQIFVVFLKECDEAYETLENVRIQGALLQAVLNKIKAKEITIINLIEASDAAYVFAEGLALSNYQFLKYKSDAKQLKHTLEAIYFDKKSISPKQVIQLETLVQAIYLMRNLINEPLQYLTAEQLSIDIAKIGKEGRFRVQTLGKAKLEQLKMGGILAVNRGSQLPPTFNILEHKPSKHVNKNPIVLVGKGIVYDTGGLSLKPTKDSMDQMKSDMSGAALVTAIMYVAGTLDLPIHIIGLIPATENRPGENAYVPGDVITMYDGTTVEVLNTDAEGRLILADALHYAKKYQPELVIDFATLTGAAAAITGPLGMVFMGNTTDEKKSALRHAGNRQYERMVELPLWKEYKEMIQSDIADLKNIGGSHAGAITAGKFLEHFTDYPWIHFDIAGVSFNNSPKHYFTKGATGFGLRSIIDFLLNYSSK